MWGTDASVPFSPDAIEINAIEVNALEGNAIEINAIDIDLMTRLQVGSFPATGQDAHLSDRRGCIRAPPSRAIGARSSPRLQILLPSAKLANCTIFGPNRTISSRLYRGATTASTIHSRPTTCRIFALQLCLRP
jgi:hypothetical protein